MIGVTGFTQSETIIKDLSQEKLLFFQKLESYKKQKIEKNKIVYEFDRTQSIQLSRLLHYSKPIERQQNQQFIVVLDKQWISIVEKIMSHYYQMIQCKFSHNNLKTEFIWIHLNQRFSHLHNLEIMVESVTFTNYAFSGEINNNINDIISSIQTTIFNKYNQIDLIKQLKIKQDEDLSQKQDILLTQYEKTYELLKKLKEKKYQQRFQELINEEVQNWYDQKVVYKDFDEIFDKSLYIKEYGWQIIQNEQINQNLQQNYEQYQQEIFEILFKQFIEYGGINLSIEIKQKRNREIQYFYVVQDLYKIYVDLNRHYSNYLKLNLTGDQFIERIYKYSKEVVDYQDVDHLGVNFKRVKTRYINEQIMAFESGLISQINNLF